ncbi:hypothetical protein [Rhodococcoides fascians]|uniref:hypothetical protein n=1 Tax=Rhodococcoides fascians TaxID=1828 RepID=UPI00055EA5C3|nr:MULTISPECIES: hypothetical protein [Rhodococcus]OZE98102.1 hypothetical protein CH301_17315 [Rhodococcus sp. 15-1189-1-1a]OZF12752.1 hypothetical protein CH299_18000 [Rhodococcus sp. 14-2686-1-2]
MPELITIVCARGIGEGLGVPTVLSLVTDPLPKNRFRVVHLNHRSEYGPIPNPLGQAYIRTREEAISLAMGEISRAPGRFVLAGYSAGADSMGDLADRIGRAVHGPLLDAKRRMIGVALIADPKNPRRDLRQQQWGVAGNRLIHTAAPVFRANDPADMIPFCDGNSPWRLFADRADGFSVPDLVGWGVGMATKLRLQQLQQIGVDWRNRDAILDLYRRALDQFHGYRTGDHTSYHRRIEPGTRKTYVANMTDKIASLA